MKGFVKGTSIAAAIGLALALWIAWLRGFAFGQAFSLNARYMSDGFFFAGFLQAGLGALLLVATTDFFDIYSYAFSSLLTLFTPFKRPEKLPSFFAYKTARAGRRGKPRFGLLIVGLVYLLLSALMLFLYYRLSA